jgi:DNA-binding NtrC family response regulator
MGATILIVDDDPLQRRHIEDLVQQFGYEAIAATGGAAALRLLSTADAPRVDAMILDLVMPDLDGLGLLARLRESGSTIPVIVQTANGSLENAISAMRTGAVDFVVNPVGAERLEVSLRNALATGALEGELARLKRSRSGTVSFKDIVTRSPKLEAVLRTAMKAAASAIPVLLEGESGVGKELIARAIHGSGERRSKPFVVVHCGAIPCHLVDSMLFGHGEAGTGTGGREVGKFLEASGGTLFLNEVGELPRAAQIKLGRAIEDREVDSLCGRKPVKVNVRLVSASTRNLSTAVTKGRLREELFSRLNVLSIAVPPLRERPEDIPELVRHFLARCNAQERKRVRMVTADAMAVLCSYAWPGNVRQLEHAIFRAVIMTEGDHLGLSDFPQIAALSASLPAFGLTMSDGAPAGLAAPVIPGLDPAPCVLAQELGPPGPAVELLDDAGEMRSLTAIEADLIRFAVGHYRGHMSQVARRLQIGRSTLYRRLKELGLEPDDTRELPVDGVAIE